MATRSLIADSRTAAGFGATDRVPASAGRILRYQLNVVASSIDEVVLSAGGWLCDRARAGWDVNVCVAGGADPRPLAILGAAAVDLDAGFPSLIRSASQVGALAVSAELLSTDTRVRDEVMRAVKRGLAEITGWGKRWPAEFGRQAEPVQHRVSTAARAFKSYALATADVSTGTVTPTETLFQIGTGSLRPLRSV